MDWMVESDRPGFNFPDISLLKDLPANTGATGEAGSIPGSGRSPGEGNGNTLQWEVPWTENPSGLQSMGLQRVG